LHHIDSYADIVKEKACLRRIILLSQETIGRAKNGESREHILGTLQDALTKWAGTQGHPGQVRGDCPT
jgi:replicative DNA helicase